MSIKWLHSFFSRYSKYVLMWALIAEMLASPLADTHPRAGALLGLSVLLMVLAGIGKMANGRIVCHTVLPLAGLWTITRILEAFGNWRESCANLSPVVGLMLSCSILWAIFDHFNFEGGPPRKPIAEAFIAYLVIATAFSQLYWVLNRFVDQAFNQKIPFTQHGTFLYFSMVTLTSVGYGGIVPLNPYVRIIAALESMSGVFFVAVVVARLVSSYRPKAIRQRRSPAEGADASVGESACECERVEAVIALSSY